MVEYLEISHHEDGNSKSHLLVMSSHQFLALQREHCHGVHSCPSLMIPVAIKMPTSIRKIAAFANMSINWLVNSVVYVNLELVGPLF